MVHGNIDILCIAETKLDKSFPKNRFVYQYNQFVYTGEYLLNHTYIREGLMTLKVRLIYFIEFDKSE